MGATTTLALILRMFLYSRRKVLFVFERKGVNMRLSFYKIIFACICGLNGLVYAREPNFKLENKLDQSIYIATATNKGTLNKLAWKQQVTEVIPDATYSEYRKTNDKTMLLVMGDPRASKGLIYQFPVHKAIYVAIMRDKDSVIIVLPQRKPLLLFLLSEEQKQLWNNNVTLDDILYREFHLGPAG